MAMTIDDDDKGQRCQQKCVSIYISVKGYIYEK